MPNTLESNDLSHHGLMALMRMMREQDEHGYNIDFDGICFGIASMAMQAILAGKYDEFCQRLKRISDFVVSDKMIKLEQEGGFKKNFLTSEDPPPEEKKQFLDFKEFFDGVALYQSPENHQKLFEPNNEATNPSLNQQSGMPLVHELIKPSGHNINKIHSFSGCYTQQDLNYYLTKLTAVFETSKQDIAVTLEDHAHTILLRYNAKNQLWNFLDANQLDKAHIPYDLHNESDSSNLALNIFEAFEIPNDITMTLILATTIYSSVKADVAVSEKINNMAVETLNNHLDHPETNKHWLQIASQNGQTETVKAILANKDIDINAKTNGCTALYTAALNGHAEVVKAILANNQVQVNIEYNGCTALHIAALNGHTEVVKAILANNEVEVNGTVGEKDVDVNPSLNGYTALHLAAFHGHTEVVKAILAKQDIKFNTVSNNVTALYLAVQNGHAKIVTELLNYINKYSHKIDDNQIQLCIRFANDKISTNDILVQKKYTSIIHELQKYNNQQNATNPTIFSSNQENLRRSLKRKAAKLPEELPEELPKEKRRKI
jgi:hypothetical protein